MSKFAIRRIEKKSAVRTRAAVMAAGIGVSVALGAGVATAAGQSGDVALTGLTSGFEAAVKAQAEAQQKAADAEKKAAEDKKRAAQEAAEAKARSWVKPVDSYTLGASFGLAGSHWSHNHSGQDFVVPSGTAVHAAHRGTVVKAGPNGGGDGPAYGNAIVIQHDGNTYTQYAHLSGIEVHVGQSVETGQEIGRSGSTGNSTGPHLHFEERTGPDYGMGVEPLKFLRDHGVSV
ncbi:M23 family metallopeptidase [Streptomyces sp. MST-110588]|uniref:M23 family metallopeptidase n=1 Tax=Streptomyces sp. MST-110588 TaxID=2833628 RepID=UPI001F5D97DA|nr:M23 family metallopeptidase [Streptomyces sp. MST-110588]UNO40593.1 M23 family metallopeptidase [Streptomyces sp. MST-110588]